MFQRHQNVMTGSRSIATRLAGYRLLFMALWRARSAFEVALPVLPILAKLGLALPAAYLLHRTIRPLSSGPARYRVLIIKKAGFNEDVIEAVGDMEGIQVFVLPRAVLKTVAVGILPKTICADDRYIIDDPVANQAKVTYRNLLKKMWRYVSWFRRYDAVLTGNWCYWAELELGRVLEEDADVPFIVLHKEGILPPAYNKVLRKLYRAGRGLFYGRRILVYQEDERDRQVEDGIARADQVVCVGMPRMDRNHKWRHLAAAGHVPARADQPTVLFLGFLPDKLLPSYFGIESDLAWDVLCEGTYRAVHQLAEENPAYDIIVRPRIQEAPEIEELMARQGARPKNLRVVPEGELMSLIEASWVVCGHNTTALLESLVVNKPVIVPHFGESLDPRYEGFNVELGDAVEHADSVEDLKERLKRYCETPGQIHNDLSAPAIAALDKWTGNSDGKASERARRAILRELSFHNKWTKK